MLLRSPAEYYYKFLLIHPDGLTNEQVEEHLAEIGIDYISNEYVDKLRSRLQPPTPFHPLDSTHARSYQFLSKHKILRMFRPDPDTKAAEQILRAPRAREFVETMLLSHAPMGKIASIVQRQRGISCTERGIQLYHHFFWNLELFDSVSMRLLLQWRYDRQQFASADGKPCDPALASASRRVSYQDPRKVAADLPFSPVAAMLVQMRMGVMPDTIDVCSRMEAARNLAALRVEECLYNAGPADAKRALDYAQTARVMHDLREVVQRPDEHLRQQLQAIALRHDLRPLPSIKTLSDGRHTVDMQPSSEEENEFVPQSDTER